MEEDDSKTPANDSSIVIVDMVVKEKALPKKGKHHLLLLDQPQKRLKTKGKIRTTPAKRTNNQMRN